MFHIAHIITPTQLIKNFSDIAKYIKDLNQPILVSQKNGAKIVFLTGDMYQSLLYDDSEEQGVIPFLGEIVNRKKSAFKSDD